MHTSICPWCYASHVEKMFDPLWAVIQRPEYANMYLSVTETTSMLDIPKQRLEEPVDGFRSRARAVLENAFTRARTRRQTGNWRESRLKSNPTLAAVRYADVSYTSIKLDPATRSETPKPKWLPLGDQYKVTNRSLLLTPYPVEADLVSKGKYARRIDKEFKAKDAACLLGKTVQQSKVNNAVSPDDRDGMIYAKKLHGHRTFLTYGAFRGVDEVNTNTAE